MSAEKCPDIGLSMEQRGWRADPIAIAYVPLNAARAFCHWQGRRLPTPIEWEVAARGPTGTKYPWGNEWDPSRVPKPGYQRKYDIGIEYARSGTRPDSASAVGVEDQLGVAAEFVADSSGVQLRGSPRDTPFEVARLTPYQRNHKGAFRCVGTGKR